MTRSAPAPTAPKPGVRVMAKYSEIVALLEYMDRKSPVKHSKTPRNPLKAMKMKDFDLPAYVRQKKDELERIEKFLKEFNKKDEKKDDKANRARLFIGLEWFALGLLCYPFFMYIQTLQVLK